MSRKSAWGGMSPASEAAAAATTTGREPEPQWYCSSDDFRRMLAQSHPQLLIPEHAIVYLGEGVPTWTPARERPHAGAGPCPDHDRIGPGSLLCCAHCHLSGFEHRLSDQLRLSGYPPTERPARAAAAAAAAARATPVAPPPATADPRRLRWWRNLSWSKTAAPPRRSA
jgi:hypothetical protein